MLGEVSEWSNVHAWKACVVKATAGSNPVLSAKANKSLFEKTFFYEIPIPFLGNVISLPLHTNFRNICNHKKLLLGEKFFQYAMSITVNIALGAPEERSVLFPEI